MKTAIISLIPVICLALSSCSTDPRNRPDIKFSIFSTEYGTSATYSKEDGLTVGVDADRIKEIIIERSGK